MERKVNWELVSRYLLLPHPQGIGRSSELEGPVKSYGSVYTKSSFESVILLILVVRWGKNKEGLVMFIGFSDIVDSKPCNYHCLYQYCNVLPHISATILVAQLTITVFLCTHVSQAASMCIRLICDCLHLQWGLGLRVFPGFTWIMVTLCKPSSLKTIPPVQLLYNLKYCFSLEAISPFLLLCPMSSCNRTRERVQTSSFNHRKPQS